MADLNEKDSALTVKITGADSSGTETNFIDATVNGVKVDGSAVTQPISAFSLPLPTGASTSVLQTTGNTSLSSIDTKLNSLASAPSSNASGLVVRPVTLELPTFTLVSVNTTVGNNKSMLAIQNTGTSIIRIREIWIINDQTTAVTGVAGTFEVRRIASFTGGTSITPVSYDTNDSLPAGITSATASTVSGESVLLRSGVWSTDEWGPGTLDVEGLDHAIQQVTPFWQQTSNAKALTVRQNQGIHVKFATNSTAGAFNIRFVFTVE